MVKIKKVVEDVRRLSGYSFSGTGPNSANIMVNDNLVINAINGAVFSMSIEQYRPFLSTISLNYEDMLGNDLYKLSDVYGWNSSLSNSTTPTNELLDVPQDKQMSRVNFWYDSKSNNSFGGITRVFNNNTFTYNPNEYENYIGNMTKIIEFTLNPLDRLTFNSMYINTYKIEFSIKLNGRLIDRFMPVLTNVAFITYFSKSGVSIHINYEDRYIIFMHHAAGGNNSFVIETRTYIASNSSCFFMYNGKIREVGARNVYTTLKQVQAYIIPYFVIDNTQDLPMEVSGELYDLFIFEAAVHLQKDLRSADTDLLNILDDKRREYMRKLSLEKSASRPFYMKLNN